MALADLRASCGANGRWKVDASRCWRRIFRTTGGCDAV